MAEETVSRRQDHLQIDLTEASTLEGKQKALDSLLSKPFIQYEILIPEIQAQSLNISDHSVFAGDLPDVCYDFEDLDILICDDIGTANIDKLFENPTSTLIYFLDKISNIVDSKFVGKIQDTYPLDVKAILNDCSPEVKASFAAISIMIRSNNLNNGFVYWTGHNMIPLGWAPQPEYPELTRCGVFEKHRAGISSHTLYWAVLNNHKDLSIYTPDGKLEQTFENIVFEKSRSGNSLRIEKDKNIILRLTKIYEGIVEHWSLEETPLPVFFPYQTEVYPDVIKKVFHDLLLSKDTILLRALLDANVVPITSGLEAKGQFNLIPSLFAIFSKAGLVHRLISTIVAIEFSTAQDIGEQTVLRSNSHLTNLFKFYSNKFGKDYFNKHIDPLIKKILDQKLYIRPTKDQKCDENAITELVMDGITELVQSGQDIPDEFRHLGSLIKSAANIRLRSRHAVFNALSGFFCLRFFTASITNPGSIIEGYPEFDPPAPGQKLGTTRNRTDFIVPYADLIQKPFNLQPIVQPPAEGQTEPPESKFSHLPRLALKLPERYEEIYNFALSVGVLRHEVKYAPPPDRDVDRGIEWLLRTISQDDATRRAFIKRVNEINDRDDERSAASYAMADLLTRFFVR